MGQLQGWLALSLAHFLAPLSTERASLTLVFALLEAFAVRFINDFDDFKRGIDRPETARPTSALALGLNMESVRLVGLVALGLMLVIGVWLLATTNALLLLILPLSFGILLCYSGGPKPLGHLALGEIIDFLFNGTLAIIFGVLVNARLITSSVVTVSLAVGCLYATLMLHNNARDVEKDALEGKRTLPQIVGPTKVKGLYSTLVVMCYVLLALGASLSHTAWPLLAVASAPFAVLLVVRVWRSRSADNLFPWSAVYYLMITVFGLSAIGWWIAA